jgi:hypothetical protein
MKSKTIFITLFLVTGMTACTFGKNAARLPVATSPRGVTASLILPTRKLSVELIEIRDDAMVVQDNQRQLLLVPYRLIRSFTPKDLPTPYTLRLGERPVGEKRLRLQSVSHFPQGMTPEIERKVLEAAGQRELVVVQ